MMPLRLPKLSYQIVIAALVCAASAVAQSEVATNDEAPTFQSGVNLVSVPVVVRDSAGKVVPDLKKEDFQLLDRGKPQVIVRFTIERPGDPPTVRANDQELEAAAGGKAEDHTPARAIASRFTAYVFDDVHLKFTDLAQVRAAAVKHLDASLAPTERAAVFTTSGQTTLDFTDDHAALRATLLRISPHPSTGGPGVAECPDISYYMADAMENKHDSAAVQIAAAEVMSCENSRSQSASQQMAHMEARRVLDAGLFETRESMRTVKAIIDRMSELAGERSIVLASPGFFVPDEMRSEEGELIDRAIHANVVLNTLDARGLYTIDPLGDVSRRTTVTGAIIGLRTMYATTEASVMADVLAELAQGTGGSFFQNNNDLLAGFKKLTNAPEVIYILWFAPENLKLDGAYHRLKINLTAAKKLNVQARRGYFAPKHLANPADEAKQQVRDLVFSREELSNPGIDLQTQFFKISDTETSVSVITHVMLKQLTYRKLDGRNADELTVVSALFDRNGNFVKAAQKVVTLRLRDQTLEKIPRITVKTEFDVPPGAYVVRLVVRDADGKLTAAQNGSLQIPN